VSVNIFNIHESKNQLEILKDTVSTLISNSAYSRVLWPAEVNDVLDETTVESILEPLPNMDRRPWIMAGLQKKGLDDPLYTGPFITDCCNGAYNEQVTNLLAEFDWALFTFFTTYHNKSYTVVTSSPELVDILTEMSEHERSVESFAADVLPIMPLPNATFYDYEQEGLFAYKTAMERGEDLPILLCMIDEDNLDQYYKWNDEIGCSEDYLWFSEFIDDLEKLDEHIVHNKWGKSKYLIFRVTSLESYLKIWGEASCDHSIADATFSWDVDIKKLKAYLTNMPIFQITNAIDDVCTWSYGQVYGGGADEHHAIYRSSDAKCTHQIWSLVKSNQISRF